MATGEFERHTERLKRVADEIRRKQEMAASLGTAERRQRNMLPDPPAVPGYVFHVVYRPAEGLSGDFYTFATGPGGTIGFALGDVSGHGIEAAIVMGMAKKVVDLYVPASGRPAELLARTNDALVGDLRRESFVTLAFGMLAPATGQVALGSAGHPPPLLVRAGGAVAWGTAKGPLVGLHRGEGFIRLLHEETLTLEPGDALVLFTDGIPEATDMGGHEFGVDRLLHVAKSRAGREVREVCGGIVEALDQFTLGRKPEDDVTLLALQRVGPGA